MAHFTSVKQIVLEVKGGITLEVGTLVNTYFIDLISPTQTSATVFILTKGKEISEVMVNNKVV